MPRVATSPRLERLLMLVPWVMAHDDATVDEVCERFKITREDLVADIGLLLHPDKTRLVYCKDYKRHLDFDQVTFTFCGYMFRPRKAFDKNRKRFSRHNKINNQGYDYRCNHGSSERNILPEDGRSF